MTYLNYFLLILSASYAVFSLSIPSKINKNIINFKEKLRGIRKEYSDFFNEKKNPNVYPLEDHIDVIFKFYIDVSRYIKETIFTIFYWIFYLSFLGIIISIISTVFNIFVEEWIIFSNTLFFLSFLILLLLFYAIGKSIILLICYTKTEDYENHIFKIEKFCENNGRVSYEEEFSNSTQMTKRKIRRISLFKFFFRLFWIRDEKFKAIFLVYYTNI